MSTEIILKLPDAMIQRLQQEAERRHVGLDEMINAALETYFDEPTDEEILENLRQGMREALAGNVRPAHEVLDEIEAINN